MLSFSHLFNNFWQGRYSIQQHTKSSKRSNLCYLICGQYDIQKLIKDSFINDILYLKMTTPCKNSKSTCCLLASFAMTIFRLLGKQLITVLAACLQSIDTSSSMCFKVSSFNSCFSPSAYPVLCKMLSMKLNEWYCKQKRILWLFKKNP